MNSPPPRLLVLPAGRGILTESHLVDDLLEVGTAAERIKTWILGQGEQLHISLATSPVQPRDYLLRVAERGVGGGDIVGGHALVRGSTLEFIQNLAGGRSVTGYRVRVCFHGFHAVISSHQPVGRFKLAQRFLQVALLLQCLRHVHVCPNKLRIQLESTLIVTDGVVKLVRQMRCYAGPYESND